MSALRFGFLDLLLVGVTIVTVWTHTPLGGIGSFAYDWAVGNPTNRPDLIAFFRSEAPTTDWSHTPIELPNTLIDGETGLPEPYRSAVIHGLPKRLPSHTKTLLSPGSESTPERLLVWLDANWEGDPETALERAAIGDDLRVRAIERAVAAGVEDPDRFSNHRRFLPRSTEKEAASIIDSVLGLATVFDLRWPVDPSIRISSPFGDRSHPTLKKKKFHNGIDLPVPIGTPLHAVQSGVVVRVHEDNVSGKYVILKHPGGTKSAYCHLSELMDKSAGDRISKGEIIGKSGNTGRSTGPHLHFVLRLNNKAIDPAPYRRAPVR